MTNPKGYTAMTKHCRICCTQFAKRKHETPEEFDERKTCGNRQCDEIYKARVERREERRRAAQERSTNRGQFSDEDRQLFREFLGIEALPPPPCRSLSQEEIEALEHLYSPP